ncbi:NAD(+)/NADH kinase [gut metagenome]|uniref:NAD(+)/NADH kinase n=1 Tax=gut metagenome TaxID=749906 RepID=J9GJU6_9ZZZZ
MVVLKHDNSSLIEIKTFVNDHYLTNYLADGLIISTPTGSTGYSLSVGGPILVPQSGTFCLSPIAPHSLSVRPVVIRDDVEIRLEVKSRSHNFLLSSDGKSESLPDTTVISVRRAPHTIKVIKINHKHFFETLRDKMMWGRTNEIDQRTVRLLKP